MKSSPFSIESLSGAARRGALRTPHGVIRTPAFAPVGTQGAVKGLTPQSLEQQGADLMLANLYHLSLRPGIDRIEQLGGIHAFTGWDGPILTDSGGFQVFSLSSLRTVDEHGVRFRNHLDGAEMVMTPESVAEDQLRIGVDIAMMLDECPPWPVDEAAAAESLERTLAWARRGRRRWNELSPSGGLYFGIVQGSTYQGLRRRAVAELVEIGFDGYAIGGVSVGEPVEEMRRAVEQTVPLMPSDRVRYLMGVGTPDDLLHAVSHGIDLFDCVIPSRNARHGLLFTSQGEIRIKNASFADDPRPIDEACGCDTCSRVSRAFVHHLLRQKELSGVVLATTHNIRFFLDFMQTLREAISSGRLAEIRPPRGSERDPGGDPGITE